MSIRKATRNEALIKYFKEHPGITMRELAEQFRPITRQRCHQIIKAYKDTDEHLIIPINTKVG